LKEAAADQKADPQTSWGVIFKKGGIEEFSVG
jgi:hypothetical protein